MLTDRDGNILLRQPNVEITERDCAGHAETALIRAACKKYGREFLQSCTLYSIAVPCAMCAGGHLLGQCAARGVRHFGEKASEFTGADPQNPTLVLPCREVFVRGEKRIEVIGPVEDIADAMYEVHKGYWNK